MVIEDDVKGFNYNDCAGDGLGLKGMKERVVKIDAALEVNTEIGKGTEIRVEIEN